MHANDNVKTVYIEIQQAAVIGRRFAMAFPDSYQGLLPILLRHAGQLRTPSGVVTLLQLGIQEYAREKAVMHSLMNKLELFIKIMAGSEENASPALHLWQEQKRLENNPQRHS